MIDSHLHVVPPNVPGAGPLSPVLDAPTEEVAAALRQQMQSAGVTHALAVGQLAGPGNDPLGVAGTLAVARLVPGLFALGAIDPARDSPEDLHQAESALSSGAVKGLFAYLGYHPEGPAAPGYRLYYELAERFRVPVVFHTGDPY